MGRLRSLLFPAGSMVQVLGSSSMHFVLGDRPQPRADSEVSHPAKDLLFCCGSKVSFVVDNTKANANPASCLFVLKKKKKKKKSKQLPDGIELGKNPNPIHRVNCYECTATLNPSTTLVVAGGVGPLSDGLKDQSRPTAWRSSNLETGKAVYQQRLSYLEALLSEMALQKKMLLSFIPHLCRLVSAQTKSLLG